MNVLYAVHRVDIREPEQHQQREHEKPDASAEVTAVDRREQLEHECGEPPAIRPRIWAPSTSASDGALEHEEQRREENKAGHDAREERRWRREEQHGAECAASNARYCETPEERLP